MESTYTKEDLIMSNEELLNEYETTVALYVVASNSKINEATSKYEKQLNELKAEILKRMN